jgi:uncharacterized FlaG/YvyC family protein
MPPSHAVVPPVVPVRAEPAIEPAKKSQADNRNSNDNREGEQQSNADNLPPQRRLTISRDTNLHSFVYRSIEAHSGEVVWQWPAEEMVRRAKQLRVAEDKLREEVKRDVDESA